MFFADKSFPMSNNIGVIDTGGWGINLPGYIVDAYYAKLGLGPNPVDFDCSLVSSFPSKFFFLRKR